MKDPIESGGTCPFRGTRIGGAIGDAPNLKDWWPKRLRVELLHLRAREANPLDDDFDYKAAFEKLDFEQLVEDVRQCLHTSRDEFWPADYGHYGPQMIRMAWHSAGTYRIADGRGGAGEGMQRFAPISSWEDNGNIDKSHRLLWPVKQKYGRCLSWADLIILAGEVAYRDMGLKTVGFGGGREDAWVPDDASYWGPEHEMVGRDRWEGDPKETYYDLENPVGASEMGLIYVNPEGPGASNDPEASAREIRETFSRMAMSDEETAALIVGGHSIGKSHGGSDPDEVGAPPEGAPIHAQKLGWLKSDGKGFAEHTMTNGIEGSWVSRPTTWDFEYLDNLLGYDWEFSKNEVTGAGQWKPKDSDARKTPDAHRKGVEHPLMMMTSDIALKTDATYREIIEKFRADNAYFEKAFAEAWYKLVHRDMGPHENLVGGDAPKEPRLWQDPLPPVDHELIGTAEIGEMKKRILASGLSVSELVSVAWASASTYRYSDMRGGANGAHIRLAPMKDWQVNNPAQLRKVLDGLENLRADFAKPVSMADMIVLGGCAAVEKAAKDAGVDIEVPFVPGRTDATDDMTDPEAMDWLQPVADGFRNYHSGVKSRAPAEQLMVDRAELLGLSAPQLTALVGGLRVLGANWDGREHGVFTNRVGVLSNDFFVNLTDFDVAWEPVDEAESEFRAYKRGSDSKTLWKATRCDLVFGHNAQLRAIAELYGAADGHEKFVRDFVRAWDMVMMADRFDLKAKARSARAA